MATCFEESLRLYRAYGARWAIKVCLAGLGGVAGMQAQTDVEQARVEDADDVATRAARLFGASAAIESHVFPAHHVEIERTVAAARTLMDGTQWEAAWAEGQAMTLEQAITYALEDDGTLD